LAVAPVGTPTDNRVVNGEWWNEQLAGGTQRLPAVREQYSPAYAPTPRSARAYPVGVADEWTHWWNYARRCARLFAAGVEPPTIEVFGPVLEADEVGLLSADVTYSRRYGGSGRYSRSDLLVLGRPAVMVGALAVNAAINHHRKVAARREAEVRWRDEHRVQVIATNYRLLCNTDEGWENYWYSDVTEFYPDLDRWSLTLGLNGYVPLRLCGPVAPALILWMATAVLGERWVSDLRVARLLQ
jgi:hypothetical protein